VLAIGARGGGGGLIFKNQAFQTFLTPAYLNSLSCNFFNATHHNKDLRWWKPHMSAPMLAARLPPVPQKKEIRASTGSWEEVM
jgi:hypothetical protein